MSLNFEGSKYCFVKVELMSSDFLLDLTITLDELKITYSVPRSLPIYGCEVSFPPMEKGLIALISELLLRS